MGLFLWLMIFLITVLSVLVGGLYIYFKIKYQHWANKKIAYRKPVWPFGNNEQPGRVHITTMINNLYKEFKDEKSFGMWMFHKPVWVVKDPDLIKSVLISDFQSFHDHGSYCNEENDPLSVNLFSLGGSKWRNLRVKLTPVFTSGKIKMMFSILAECGEELRETIREYAEKEQEIEVKELIARYTTDVISSAAFGIQTNSLKNPDAIFRQMGKKVLEPTFTVLFKTVMNFLLPEMAEFFKIVINPKDVTEFFIGAIKETIDYREANGIIRNDALQLLMELKNKGYLDDADAKSSTPNVGEKDKFTFEMLAAQAFIFFAGGFESSSSTIQFALYELSLKPEIQTKLHDEIRRILKKHDNKLTYEAVHEMELLSRVVNETLRLYPPALMLPRVCTKDFVIPGTNTVIEKGTSLFIPVMDIQRDEQHFPNPDQFDPDRFSEEGKKSIHPCTYMPFGDGPRVCIGQRFGLMQVKVGLISLLSNYQFHVSERTPIPMLPDPKATTYAPKGGVHLKVTLAN